MNNETTAPAQDENQIIAERRAKLAAIRAAGIAFPNDFERRDYAGQLAAAHGDTCRPPDQTGGGSDNRPADHPQRGTNARIPAPIRPMLQTGAFRFSPLSKRRRKPL